MELRCWQALGTGVVACLGMLCWKQLWGSAGAGTEVVTAMWHCWLSVGASDQLALLCMVTGWAADAGGCRAGAAAGQLLRVPQAAAPLDVRPGAAVAPLRDGHLALGAAAGHQAGAAGAVLWHPQVRDALGLARLLLHARAAVRVHA